MFAYNQFLSSLTRSFISVLPFPDDNNSSIFTPRSIVLLHASPFIKNAVFTNYTYFVATQKDLLYDLFLLLLAYITSSELILRLLRTLNYSIRQYSYLLIY
jgi:hypothetical protein